MFTRLSFFILAASVSASAGAQCKTDMECKGDRICVRGECVDPAPRAADAPRPPDSQVVTAVGETPPPAPVEASYEPPSTAAPSVPPVGSSSASARPKSPPRVSEPSRSSWAPDPTKRKVGFIVAHPLATIAGAILGSAAGISMFMLPIDLGFAASPYLSLVVSASPVIASSGYSSVFGTYFGGYVEISPVGSAPDGLFFRGGAALVTVGSGGAADLNLGSGYRWILPSGFTISVGGGLSIFSLATGRFPLYVEVPVGFAF